MPTDKKGPQKISRYISLKNIDPAQILFKYYGSSEAERIDEKEISTVVDIDNDISITELMHERSKKTTRSMFFIDPYKNTVKFWINMISITQNGALPLSTDKDCWGPCRSTFTTHPLGCPIKYIQEPLKDSLEYNRLVKKFKEWNLPLDKGFDYFETEGLFCSFSCMKAYILDELSKTKSGKYKKALDLMTFLYFKFYEKIITIPKTESWKNLKKYCGHLTPKELRAAAGQLEYVETINIRRPYMFSSSMYIQEKKVKV